IEIFFNDDLVARIAESTGKARVDGGVRLRAGRRDRDPFARCETIGLDHDRQGLARGILLSWRRGREATVRARRNPELGAQVLRETLRTFELRGCPCRPERLDPSSREIIDDASDERLLRADDDEIDALV